MFALINLSIAAALFAVMVVLEGLGWRLGERQRQRLPKGETIATTVAEGAVFGLLGLVLAFTFSGAGARYEERWHLVVSESNAIGTAWLRIDVLPAAAQPEIRDLFRQYLDARIDRYRLVSGLARIKPDTGKAAALQKKIWAASVAAASSSGQFPPYSVFLPALNQMFDLATSREAARRLHPPVLVFVMVAILTFVGALFAGYGMSGRSRSWLHVIGFAAVLTMTLFVIVDYEFPRVGLIRLDPIDSLLIDLRQSMK
jgi:hypothetical protein